MQSHELQPLFSGLAGDREILHFPKNRVIYALDNIISVILFGLDYIAFPFVFGLDFVKYIIFACRKV